jgi:hypothetical protein
MYARTNVPARPSPPLKDAARPVCTPVPRYRPGPIPFERMQPDQYVCSYKCTGQTLSPFEGCSQTSMYARTHVPARPSPPLKDAARPVCTLVQMYRPDPLPFQRMQPDQYLHLYKCTGRTLSPFKGWGQTSMYAHTNVPARPSPPLKDAARPVCAPVQMYRPDPLPL